ncbi:MAG TPA: pitrilysin family protein [Polyangiaceae bacterium]|jgi:zinc protease|nr:pitrilysin family protein [Polyangiaceae bacterium]
MNQAPEIQAPARARREPFAELLAELNKDRFPTAKIRHDATIAFGPEMQVHRFVLGNGLKVLILEDHAAPVACLQVWFGVGSRHEKVGKTGISHLFEHLMFGETDKREHGAFDKLLEEAGAETNAATFLDWTYYHANLPKDALALAVALEAERMTGLILRDPQVTSEKEVVANERRQHVDDDVDGAVSELLYKEAFREHAYRWPTIGWMEDIQGFTTEDCMAFYRTYYAPNNATMVVVGDVETREVLSLVQEHYGKIEPSIMPIEDVRPEPPQTEERRQRVTKPTPTQKVAMGFKSPALGDFDYAPLVLLNELLFGGRSSRVHRALVQEQEIATEVRGSVGAFHDPSLYDIYLVARGEHTTEELISALDAILDEVRREAPGEGELDKAKARVELATLQGLETVAGKAGQIGFYEVVVGSPAALFEKLDEYRRVKRDDLLRVARRYLVPTGRTMIEVIPQEGKDEEDEGPEDGEQEEAS